MNKIPRFLWLALRFKLATLWMAWGSGLLASRMENEEQSVQDLVVGFAIQACCSLEKKACKWKWSKNVVTRYYVLLRAYKLHKLVHATQARSRYQNTRYQATQIRRKILFSRFGDVHYWTMRHSHANSFEVCIFRRDLSSRSRVCQHNRCRHMLQQWCIFKTWSVACCGFPRKMVDKSIRTMHDRSRGVLDLKFLVCILAM